MRARGKAGPWFWCEEEAQGALHTPQPRPDSDNASRLQGTGRDAAFNVFSVTTMVFS